MNEIYLTDAGAARVADAYREILREWPTPNEQMRVPTRHGETFVVACGPRDAPPVLLFHGAISNAAAWMFDAPAWARHFRLYAIDMIGETGFSAPARPPLDSDAYATWIDDILAALGVGRAGVVGVSLGGWLAFDYAVRRPDRVTAVAALCPAGIGAQKNFMLAALPLLLLGPWGARKMRELVFGPAMAATSPTMARFGEFLVLLHANARRRIIKIPRVSDAALKALSVPVLAIVGGKDVMLDSADTRRRLQTNVAGAEVHYLPGARHVLRGQGHVIEGFLRRALA